MEQSKLRAWRTPAKTIPDGALDPRRVGHLSAYGIIATMAADGLRPNEADILIVDDDNALRKEMADYLAGHGFVIHQARDAVEARSQLQKRTIQVVILDVMLPGEDGLSLCRSLAGSVGPSVLMLSSMGESIDRVLGLELGADDYVVKPVTPRELLARVRALLRRRGAAGAPSTRTAVYAFSGFRLDVVRRRLRAPDETVIMLTPGELSLLGALVENPQRVLSRDELARFSRGDSAVAFDRAIDVQISRLRKKLNEQSGTEIIKTHRGLGYILDSKVTRV